VYTDSFLIHWENYISISHSIWKKKWKYIFLSVAAHSIPDHIVIFFSVMLQTELRIQDGSRLPFSSPFSCISFFKNVLLPRFTLYRIFFLLRLPCHLDLVVIEQQHRTNNISADLCIKMTVVLHVTHLACKVTGILVTRHLSGGILSRIGCSKYTQSSFTHRIFFSKSY